jgi:hypothetical protein
MRAKTFDELICDNDRPSSRESLVEAQDTLKAMQADPNWPTPQWITREEAILQAEASVDFWKEEVRGEE